MSNICFVRYLISFEKFKGEMDVRQFWKRNRTGLKIRA